MAQFPLPSGVGKNPAGNAKSQCIPLVEGNMTRHQRREKERLERARAFRAQVTGFTLDGQVFSIPRLLAEQKEFLDWFNEEETKERRRLNATLEAALEESRMKGRLSIPLSAALYHGTDANNIGSILKDGILPRGDRQPNHPHMPSHPGMVYLTDAFAIEYGVMASGGHDIVVFEVMTHDVIDDLYPDEDALLDKDNWRDPQGLLEEEAERDFVGSAIVRSLYHMGRVAHKGVIAPERITRMARIPATTAGAIACSTKSGDWGSCFIRRQQNTILDWVFDGGDKPFPVGTNEIVPSQFLGEQILEALRDCHPAEMAAFRAAGVLDVTVARKAMAGSRQFYTRKGIEVVEVGKETAQLRAA
jgi:hypothetical protein